MSASVLDKGEGPKCGMVTDHTCDDNGDINGEIECGAYAEWQDECGNPVCTSCYYEHSLADRALFTYVDKLEGIEAHVASLEAP